MTEDWTSRAACSGVSTAVMFPTITMGRNSRQRLEQASRDAKALCQRCPVIDECKALWVEIGRPTDGVWFGKTAQERRRCGA